MKVKKGESIIILLAEAFKESVRDQFQNIAGALAYYLFLSLAPLIGFSIYLSNKVLGHERTVEQVIPFLKAYFSPQFVKVIVFFLHKNRHVESDGLLTLSILAGIALVYSTKEYFGMVKDAIELTWNKRGDRFGVIPFFKRLIEDMSVALTAIAIIFIFIALGIIWPYSSYPAVTPGFWELVVYYISSVTFEFFLFFTLFFFCFLFLPPVEVKAKNAVVPALIGALLQVSGREIMKVHTLNYPDSGLAESFLVVLLWFYYSSLAFIYSSEFAKVYISLRQNIDYTRLQFSSR